MIEEQDHIGAALVVYTYGDDLLNQQRLEGVYHYHYDGLGSTRVLSDASGVETDRYVYKAFGELESQSGDETPNVYLFTGEQFDPNVQFYYLRARYYDQANGRFVGMDLFPGMTFEPSSLHKYLYVVGSPVDLVDPSGHFPVSLAEVGIGLRLFALQSAVFLAPTLYMANHVATRIGSVQLISFVRASTSAIHSGLYRLAGLPERVLRLSAGQMFERLVKPAMDIMRAAPQFSIRAAGRVVARADWLWLGRHIIDTKLGQYVDLKQLAHFVTYAASQPGGSVTYITLTRTPPALVQSAVQIGNAAGVAVTFIPLTPF